MKKQALIAIAAVSLSSCASDPSQTDAIQSVLKQLPPVKVIKQTKGGKEVSVTVYPDGSQPTEVLIDGQPITEPVEIKL